MPSLLARGAAAGAVATVPMSVVMLAAQRRGRMGELPPERIAEDAGRAATGGATLPRRTTRLVATVAHFAFGAAAGAAYAWATDRAGRRGPGWGVAYGTAVWATSYFGWVPALGILPPPPRDRPGRPTSMVLAHWVFGATLDAALARAR